MLNKIIAFVLKTEEQATAQVARIMKELNMTGIRSTDGQVAFQVKAAVKAINNETNKDNQLLLAEAFMKFMVDRYKTSPQYQSQLVVSLVEVMDDKNRTEMTIALIEIIPQSYQSMVEYALKQKFTNRR